MAKREDMPALSITVAGKKHVIRFSDLNGLDARDYRATTGLGLAEAFSSGLSDIDTIAALLWVYRRKRNPKLTYEMVAKELTYESLEDADLVDESKEDAESPDPTDTKTSDDS